MVKWNRLDRYVQPTLIAIHLKLKTQHTWLFPRQTSRAKVKRPIAGVAQFDVESPRVSRKIREPQSNVVPVQGV
jgi:hypothetical protein